MDILTAFGYTKPHTLALIIADALDHITPMASDEWRRDVKEIVTDAWNALVANAGAEDAMDELLKVGIGPDEMDWIWS